MNLNAREDWDVGYLVGLSDAVTILKALDKKLSEQKCEEVEDDYAPQPDEMPTHYQDERGEWHDELDDLLK